MVAPDGRLFTATPTPEGGFILERREADGSARALDGNVGIDSVLIVDEARFEAMRLRPADARVVLEADGSITPTGRPLSAAEQGERDHALAAISDLNARREANNRAQLAALTPPASAPPRPRRAPPAPPPRTYASEAHLPNLAEHTLRTASGRYVRLTPHAGAYLVSIAGDPERLREARTRSMSPAEVVALQLVPNDPLLRLAANGSVERASACVDTVGAQHVVHLLGSHLLLPDGQMLRLDATSEPSRFQVSVLRPDGSVDAASARTLTANEVAALGASLLDTRVELRADGTVRPVLSSARRT
jgi:hypothetical protein